MRQPGRLTMVILSALLLAAQLVDIVWPRADDRAASPASVVFALVLVFVLATFPTATFVPRWILPVALIASALFVTASIVGPDVTETWLWPLPLAPFLLALVIGGQGYRYLRRSTAAEREAVRWPLLGTLLLLAIVVPADVVSVALTGDTIEGSGPLGTAMQFAFLLPALGFLVGALAPANELVDRLLAGYLAVVASAIVLGALFAGILALVSLAAPAPGPAWVAGAVTVLASIWVIPYATRLSLRIVFRRRVKVADAASVLASRLTVALDPAELPGETLDTVLHATGARAAALRRTGQAGTWARAGEAETEDVTPYEVDVVHLGLPVATLSVWPREAESTLTAADRRIIDSIAAAAAPALHGARLASAFPELTERERQVLSGIVRGLPNSVIAARLGVSGKTVANYVSIVLAKLRVPDKERAAELVRRRAAELG